MLFYVNYFGCLSHTKTPARRVAHELSTSFSVIFDLNLIYTIKKGLRKFCLKSFRLSISVSVTKATVRGRRG